MALFIAVGVLILGGAVRAANWTTAGGGNWFGGSNWDAADPNAVGATANLTADIGADAIVNLNNPATVGNMTIADGGATYYSYTISSATNTLTFDNTTAPANLTVSQGAANVISSPVSLVDDLLLTIQNSAKLTISGAITASKQLQLAASTGTLRLEGTNSSFSGGIQFRGNPGSPPVLEIANDSALGTGALTPYNYTTVTLSNVKGSELTLANTFNPGGAGSRYDFTTGDFRLTGTVSGGGNGGPSFRPALGVTVTLPNGVTGSEFAIAGAGTLKILASSTSNLSGIFGNTRIEFSSDQSFGSAASFYLNGGNPTLVATGGARVLAQSINMGTKRLYVDGANDLTLNGDLSNGAVQKDGSSTLILNGTNSYPYGTFLNSGVLRLGSANALPSSGNLKIAGGAVVELAAGNMTRPLSNTNASNVTLNYESGGFAALGANRIVNFGGAGATVQWGDNTAFVGTGKTLILGSANANAQIDFQNAIDLTTGDSWWGPANKVRTIQVNDNPNSTADIAVISGQLTAPQPAGYSLNKTGNGVLVLTANNTHAIPTTVSQGTLLVNGTHSGGGTYSVASGATLGGSGSISGLVTVDSGGHLAPGASPGTLTLTSGLTLNSGDVLDFDIGLLASDLLRITGGTFTGSSDTGGITVNLSQYDVFNPGDYTLINWQGATPSGVDFTDFVVGAGPNRYNYSFSIQGSTLVLNAIPEPGAILLLALGGALCLRRRR